MLADGGYYEPLSLLFISLFSAFFSTSSASLSLRYLDLLVSSSVFLLYFHPLVSYFPLVPTTQSPLIVLLYFILFIFLSEVTTFLLVTQLPRGEMAKASKIE